MMKRKLKWLAIVFGVLVLGIGTAFFLWPRDRITPESWKTIRIGMTVEEVEAILGGPGMKWKDYMDQWALAAEIGKPRSSRISFREGEEPKKQVWWDAKNSKVWPGTRALIGIQFDEGGHVMIKIFEEWLPANPNFIDRLRDWLGW
jgi:hypothetical protein